MNDNTPRTNQLKFKVYTGRSEPYYEVVYAHHCEELEREFREVIAENTALRKSNAALRAVYARAVAVLGKQNQIE